MRNYDTCFWQRLALAAGGRSATLAEPSRILDVRAGLMMPVIGVAGPGTAGTDAVAAQHLPGRTSQRSSHTGELRASGVRRAAAALLDSGRDRLRIGPGLAAQPGGQPAIDSSGSPSDVPSRIPATSARRSAHPAASARPPPCIAPGLARELGDDHTVAIGAPMRATARRNLEAAAARSGAWLGIADVLRRQAGHRAEPHVIAAAGNLVTHLAATGENTPGGSGMLMTPAEDSRSASREPA